jgi:dTDP-4-amino-4,6-dideoxygalactose transaminase
MENITTLEAFIASQMQRRFARLVGRGTTALYVALRALALRDGLGEVILPDIICSNVLDAVLLAGFTPIFADVTSQRFAIDPSSIQRQITSATRAVIVAHLFGYMSPIHDYGVPIIEDAVQGLGGTVNGNLVGTIGAISFTSFNETKMIGGQGGAVATDDEGLFEAIHQVNLEFDEFHEPISSRYALYLHQLAALRNLLIRPFDNRPENVVRIHAGWEMLASNVAERNRKAQYLRDSLANLPLELPEICPGDAIWRYSFAAPNRATTNWILRHLQMAGLSGSNLYPSLSNIFAPELTLISQSFAPNIINLWVDAETDQAQLDRAIAIIRSTPWSRLGVTD